MTSVVVVGSQWGDEGKGKITDFLSKEADCIARFSGGNNAGHTIKFGGETYKLHVIPSGIFYPEKLAVIGNGVVVDPKHILQELKGLKERGIDTSNLRISNRATVVLPYHLKQDELEEERRGENKIGTTKKGIGPAYMDKVARIGIRMADLIDREVFESKLRHNVAEKNRLFEKFFEAEGVKFEDIFEEYYAYGQELAKYVCDASKILNDSYDAGNNILFEGAQGIMLDVDYGTYPFVTSSNPVAGGVTIGSGVGPTKVDRIVGVCKAYTTRVGDGPFPTELFDEVGQTIREVGREYGTTTGRPRRVGWFDSVVMRHAVRVSGITDLSLNCIDVLSGLEEVSICVAYEHNGERLTEYPANLRILAECTPVYETMPGWSEDITAVKTLEELPAAAQNYLKRVEELSGAQISIFSVGPDRDQTNVLRAIY